MERHIKRGRGSTGGRAGMHDTRFAYAYFQLVAFLIDSVVSGLHHRVMKLELPGDRGEALALCQYVRAVLYGDVEGFCVRQALAKRFRAEVTPTAPHHRRECA